MLVFLLIAALVALRSAANLRTKREELRKLQKKLSRAKRTSDSRAINELESQISALRDDIDGIAPKVEESTPLPLPKKAPPPPEKVVETPSPPKRTPPVPETVVVQPPPTPPAKQSVAKANYDASSIREYIKEWRSNARKGAKERVARLLDRVSTWFSLNPLCKVVNKELHSYTERISRLENDLVGMYESFGLKIQGTSSLEKIRELKEERKIKEAPLIEDLASARELWERTLLASC